MCCANLSSRIDPQYLDFEITESLLIRCGRSDPQMRRIKSLGAQFSIDDFGIGYSSMVYLKRLPFDHLKIDREFIRISTATPVSRYGPNHHGGVPAVRVSGDRRGVERPESLEVLRQVGCDHYQGARTVCRSPGRFQCWPGRDAPSVLASGPATP